MALRRTLGITDLTLLTIGSVIGSGIFLVPSGVLRQSGGSVRIATTVWLLGGLLSLLGALSYGELGSLGGKSGGLYSYIRDGFGELPAFLYGWTLFFVIAGGTVAALAVAASTYLGQFVALSPSAAKATSVALIAVMMVINVRGTRGSATVQNVATAVKVAAILAMCALLFVLGHPPEPTAQVSEPMTVTRFGLALVSVLWAYEGWQYVTFSDAEAVDPQRTIPRALALGTVALIAIYVLANFAYLAALGPEGVMASERVAGDATAAVLGPAASFVAVAIIVSMYSAAHATVITAPRVYYAMAQEGLFFKSLARVHPTFGTPAIAVVASCVWAMLLALTGTFNQLLTYVVFIGWIFYALGAAAVIALRIRKPDVPRGFRVPFYPLPPVLFIIAAGAIVVSTVVEQPMQSALGIGIVLLGLPAYFFWRRSAS